MVGQPSRRRRAQGDDDDEEEDDAFASAGESEGSADEGGKPEPQAVEKPPKEGGSPGRESNAQEFDIHSEDNMDKNSQPQESTPDKDVKKGEKKEDEENAETRAPRDGRYFLHDDRGKEDDADEAEAEEEEGKGKGKGKKRDLSADDPGPWLHDKFHELMEAAPRKPKPQKAPQRSQRGAASWEQEEWSAGAWDTADSWNEGGWDEGWQQPSRPQKKGQKGSQKGSRNKGWQEESWGGKADDSWDYNSWNKQPAYRDKDSYKENNWSNQRDSRNGSKGGRDQDSWGGGKSSWDTGKQDRSRDAGWGKNDDYSRQSRPTRYSQMTF